MGGYNTPESVGERLTVNVYWSLNKVIWFLRDHWPGM